MKTAATILGLLALSATAALAAESCATGKTLEAGVLTIATGNPAYFPWVIDDRPEGGEGFEAALAYALAERMGFDRDHVAWVRTSFDEAIQPGPKNFDLNMQQFSITPERDQVVDFSAPYYSSAMAVLTTKSVVEAGTRPELPSLKGLVWGVAGGTTAIPMLTELIGPEKAPMVYNDNADVTAAMQAGQIDAALFDLPTALYLAAAVVEGGVVLGQFPADRTENPDRFGAILAEGNPLKACVDEALAALSTEGELARIEAKWLAETTGAPVIE